MPSMNVLIRVYTCLLSVHKKKVFCQWIANLTASMAAIISALSGVYASPGTRPLEIGQKSSVGSMARQNAHPATRRRGTLGFRQPPSTNKCRQFGKQEGGNGACEIWDCTECLTQGSKTPMFGKPAMVSDAIWLLVAKLQAGVWHLGTDVLEKPTSPNSVFKGIRLLAKGAVLAWDLACVDLLIPSIKNSIHDRSQNASFFTCV